jgi:hypothetical protein
MRWIVLQATPGGSLRLETNDIAETVGVFSKCIGGSLTQALLVLAIVHISFTPWDPDQLLIGLIKIRSQEVPSEIEKVAARKSLIVIGGQLSVDRSSIPRPLEEIKSGVVTAEIE